MVEVTFQALESRDLPAVLELLAQSGLPQDGVRENIPAFVVARERDRVIACGGVEPYERQGLLRSVAVEAAQRGRGIGDGLLRCLIERSARQGLHCLYLLTTSAEGYFARFGFELCSRDEAPPAIRSSWQFRSGCPNTAVFMKRSISRPGPDG